MNMRNQQGFTLIEIMIAVAILALISAIAVPLYQGYIVEARSSTAVKDLRQFELILKDLAEDNDLGAAESGGYTVGTDLGVYRQAGGSPVLSPVGTTPAGATAWNDPWGSIYRYRRLNNNRSPQPFRLYSQGPTADSSDDVIIDSVN
jgi:prepilin-type N-terminal cleavage/methylation domain-containing protein